MRLNVSPEEAQTVLLLVEADIAAHKNWIATAVESGETGRAQDLVKQLRKLQEMSARFRKTILRGA